MFWLLKNHPEMKDAAIMRLVGTTKPTIASIRDRSHWNIGNIQAKDPVTLGLCSQRELDAVVARAAKKGEGLLVDFTGQVRQRQSLEYEFPDASTLLPAIGQQVQQQGVQARRVGAGGQVTFDYSFDRLGISSGGNLYYYNVCVFNL